MDPHRPNVTSQFPDRFLPREFQFDAEDSQWFRRLRESASEPWLGQIGDYELLEEAGRGGQGVVFKARQPRTGRIVAIKRLSAGAFATREMRDRFKREVEAAAVLEHPGIVTVFGSEIVDGQAVLAMQWIDGQPINQWVRPPSGDPRSPREVLHVFEKLCDAVQHAHQRGVIHRDLKPSNILIDREGRPHVLDLGLAKLQSDAVASLTLTGDFLGTPLYAAPEQLGGKSGDVDIRTDVYSLGAVLYQCLTGQTVFAPCGSLKDMFDAVQLREPASPLSLNPQLDREINAIVLKALAKEKEQRYASVDALRADLERYLSGTTVLAHPPSSAYRLRKFIRYHRVAVGAVASFVVLLVGATITSTLFYFRAERQTVRAVREAETQKAISHFVQNMLQRAAPYPFPANKDITVREALQAAAKEIDDKKVTYLPAVEAALRHSIASTLHGIGSFQEALQIEREAVRLSQIAQADGEPPCVNCYIELAILQKEFEDYAAAVETLNEALAALHDAPENPSPERPEILRNLGMIRWRQGDFRASEQIAREAKRLSMEFWPNNVEFVEGMNIVISSLVPNNAPDHEAETMARKTLKYLQAKYPGGADYAFQLFWLAMLVHERGELDEAERLAKESIQITTALRGGDISVATTNAELALIYRDQERLDEAEQLMREVVKTKSEALGDANRATIDMQVKLATVLHARHHDSEALAVLETALSSFQKKLGEDNIHTVRVESFLAPVLAAVGRAKEAEQYFRHALAIRREVLGERSETATNLHELGALLLEENRPDEAKPLLEEALAMRRTVRGPDHRETKETEQLLAMSR